MLKTIKSWFSKKAPVVEPKLKFDTNDYFTTLYYYKKNGENVIDTRSFIEQLSKNVVDIQPETKEQLKMRLIENKKNDVNTTKYKELIAIEKYLEYISTTHNSDFNEKSFKFHGEI